MPASVANSASARTRPSRGGSKTTANEQLEVAFKSVRAGTDAGTIAPYPPRERLLGEPCSGCAGGAEGCQFHGGCLSARVRFWWCSSVGCGRSRGAIPPGRGGGREGEHAENPFAGAGRRAVEHPGEELGAAPQALALADCLPERGPALGAQVCLDERQCLGLFVFHVAGQRIGQGAGAVRRL